MTTPIIATVITSSEADATYALVEGRQDIARLQQEYRIYGSSEGPIATARSAPTRLRLALEEVAVGLTKGFLRLEVATNALSNNANSTSTSSESSSVATSDKTRQELSPVDIIQEITGDLNRRGPRGSKSRLAPRRRDRVRVFRDLWERGYVVTAGSKFGADFLIYKDDPKRAHAEALIVVKAYEEEFARVDVVSFCRVAKMVRKQFLFASVRSNGDSGGDDGDKDEDRDSDVAVDSVVYVSLTHAVLVSRHQERSEEGAMW
uniref:tRNA-intron lyase n=1 Tax=Peronospora matthiolae TaxID=2874970 RepID=A0AAV1TNW8_9STRA